MKTKLLLSTLLSFSFYLLSSQVPQGFNYQAIARDGSSGDPITGKTMQVRIGILSDTIANIMVWEELFNPVRTNAFGMFNIVVGTGIKQSGSASSFSAIDWTKTPLFLRTSIYYPSSWKVMGTSKLQSVPYSMVAGNLEGSVPLLSVKGSTTTMDSALFVVRNNTGQIVFAVYNEGVRIYVDNGVAKGATKGGFAIGSFDRSKGTSQPLFVVDPDSIRAYLDNNPVKAVKGGFAIGGFDKSKSANQNFLSVSKDSIRMYIDDNLTTKSSKKGGFAIGSFDKSKGGNINYLNVSTDSTGIINPSENRILWYPLKDAFLTGNVLIESKDSVGVNSFTSGYQSKSKGKYSQALGYKAIARGDYSTAIGKNALANKINSFACGDSARAINLESYAIGRGAVASGYRSFAFGSAGVDTAGNPTGVSKAFGDYSFAIGQGSQSLGKGAFAIGIADTARGDFSVSLGFKTSAGGLNSIAFGIGTSTIGFGSTAFGVATKAIGDQSTSMGSFTVASGVFSTAMGNHTTAVGAYSTSIGNLTKATGYASIAMGEHTQANGSWSTASGNYTMANGFRSTATGVSTTAIGSCSTTMGSYTTAIGSCSTTMGSYTTAVGAFSTAMGARTKAKPYASLSIGQYNDTTCTTGGDLSWTNTDPVFIIGNGTADNARLNAMTVLKNGCIGLQTIVSPTYALQLPNSSNIAVGSGRAYAWTTYSDGRLKENQVPIAYGLKELMELSPMQYIHHSSIDQSIWSKENAPKTIGLIAQEVYKIIPEAVDVPKNNINELWGLNYDKLVPVLVKAIQEQQQQIESTKQENQQLRSELDELKTLVNTLVANQTGQGNK